MKEYIENLRRMRSALIGFLRDTDDPTEQGHLKAEIDRLEERAAEAENYFYKNIVWTSNASPL